MKGGSHSCGLIPLSGSHLLTLLWLSHYHQIVVNIYQDFLRNLRVWDHSLQSTLASLESIQNSNCLPNCLFQLVQLSRGSKQNDASHSTLWLWIPFFFGHEICSCHWSLTAFTTSKFGNIWEHGASFSVCLWLNITLPVAEPALLTLLFNLCCNMTPAFTRPTLHLELISRVCLTTWMYAEEMVTITFVGWGLLIETIGSIYPSGMQVVCFVICCTCCACFFFFFFFWSIARARIFGGSVFKNCFSASTYHPMIHLSFLGPFWIFNGKLLHWLFKTAQYHCFTTLYLLLSAIDTEVSASRGSQVSIPASWIAQMP